MACLGANFNVGEDTNMSNMDNSKPSMAANRESSEPPAPHPSTRRPNIVGKLDTQNLFFS